MRPPIVLWAVPRSVSTAFERGMRARGDLTVLSEPFSVPYYHGENRVSARFGAPAARPAAGAWWKVVDDLEATAREGPVFVKDMAYQVSPVLGRALVSRFQNTFIIRHPALTLRSLAEILPDFSPEEAGFARQRRLMELVAETSGEAPVVVDAEELRRSPAAVVEAYCQRVGIPYLPSSLSWQPGLLEDWNRWAGWHGEVASSTGFRPPAPDEPTAKAGPPQGVDRELYASCLEDYERMLELGGLTAGG